MFSKENLIFYPVSFLTFLCLMHKIVTYTIILHYVTFGAICFSMNMNQPLSQDFLSFDVFREQRALGTRLNMIIVLCAKQYSNLIHTKIHFSETLFSLITDYNVHRRLSLLEVS